VIEIVSKLGLPWLCGGSYGMLIASRLYHVLVSLAGGSTA
jgi:hypothetical protein